MRLRNKNWTINYINDHHDWMINYEQKLVDLPKQFNNDNKRYALEIGCGKGQFILQQALRNPKINFLGIEKERTVIGVALKKAVNESEQRSQPINNLKFCNTFAENLNQMFPPKSFETIYLNFSDPWPKAKHFKKRLTYETFLDQYAILLVENGSIEIKTDNKNLYEFSLQQAKQHPRFEIVFQTDDLYANQEHIKENIATEYEFKFIQNSLKINKIILKLK